MNSSVTLTNTPQATQSLPAWRLARSSEWFRGAGRSEWVGLGFVAGFYDPPPMPVRSFNLRTERYE